MHKFSWEAAKKEAIIREIEIEMIHAKRGDKEDKLKHPDWVTQAQTNNFVDLKKKVREQMENLQDNAMQRRLKRVGK